MNRRGEGFLQHEAGSRSELICRWVKLNKGQSWKKICLRLETEANVQQRKIHSSVRCLYRSCGVIGRDQGIVHMNMSEWPGPELSSTENPLPRIINCCPRMLFKLKITYNFPTAIKHYFKLASSNKIPVECFDVC